MGRAEYEDNRKQPILKGIGEEMGGRQVAYLIWQEDDLGKGQEFWVGVRAG